MKRLTAAFVVCALLPHVASACRPVALKSLRPTCASSRVVLGADFDACLAACVADTPCNAFVAVPECRLLYDAKKCTYAYAAGVDLWIMPVGCRAKP